MKKLYRILGSVLICFSVMFGNFTVFAASPTVQVSNYTDNSTFTYGDNKYYAQYRTIFINCSAVSSGTVVIDFSGMSSSYKTILNSYKWFSEGCRVSYNSSTYKLTVSLSGVQFCTIGAYYITTSYTGFNLSYSITNNLTVNTDGTDDYYDSVLSEFDSLEAYASDIASDLDTVKLYLVDLMGDVGDINTAMSSVTSYLSSLNTAVSSLKTLATSSNAAVTSILNYLISVDDNVEGIYDSVTSAVTLLQSIYDLQSDDSLTLEDIDSVINSILTSSNNIESDVDQINLKLSSIASALGSISTSLNNIDDTLDTISWNDFSGTYTFGGYNSAGNDWNTISSNQSVSYSYNGYNITTSIGNFSDYILWIRIPVYTSSKNCIPYMIRSNNTVTDLSDYSYIKYSRFYCDVFIYDLPFTNNAVPNKFVLNNGNYIYITTSNTHFIKYIDQTDIEYWQLLQYFNQYKSNLEIISLLQDLNGFTDGSVDDSSFSSDDSTFDSTFNDYHNTTDSIFDTFEDSVSNLDLTDSAFSLTDSAVNGLQFLSNKITLFVGANTGISILFYFPLLLGVIMLFLGIRR